RVERGLTPGIEHHTLWEARLRAGAVAKGAPGPRWAPRRHWQSPWVTIDSGAFTALVSGILDRLAKPQPLCDQFRAFLIVASVQDARVLWIGAPVVTGRPRVHSRVRVRTSREVAGRAVG